MHAWAVWRVYNMEKFCYGHADRDFLKKCFHKLFPVPSRKRFSYRDFDYSVHIHLLDLLHIYRQTALHRLLDVNLKFVVCVTMSGPSGDGGYLGPIEIFFIFVDHRFNFHIISLRVNSSTPFRRRPPIDNILYSEYVHAPPTQSIPSALCQDRRFS